MAPKAEISDIRREELTQAALKCIANKGYDRVTLDNVTREAGLSKGIASYYFKNREELLVSVIHKMWDNVVGLTRKIWELPDQVDDEQEVYRCVKAYYANPGIDPKEVIRNAIQFLVAWFDDNPHIMRVILEFWCQVPRNSMITELNHSMHKTILNTSAVILEEGMNQGVFRKQDPHLAAYVLISAVTGFSFNHVINKGDFDSRKLEQELCDLFFDYLCEEP